MLRDYNLGRKKVYDERLDCDNMGVDLGSSGNDYDNESGIWI